MIRTILSVAAGACIAGVPASADVVISAHGGGYVDCQSGNGNTVCVPTETDAVLNVKDLEYYLGSGNVTILTTNGSIQANNIDIASPLTLSSMSALTLDAWQSITFSAHVEVPADGGVSLVTNDGRSGGMLTFAIGKGSLNFASTKSPLSINGKTYKLASNVKQLAAGIAAKPSGHFALSRDYNAEKDGTYASAPIPTSFGGAFNGLGHTISNLEVFDHSDSNVGLFAYVAGSLASLTLRDAAVSAKLTAGLLAGENTGTIINASTSGRVHGAPAGGIAGQNSGTISLSQSATHVRGYRLVGGIAGENYGKILLSFATGKVSGTVDVGGLLGISGTGGTAENCYALGAVDGISRGGYDAYEVGGFVGYIYSGEAVTTSYSIGTVSGSGFYIGGFDGADHGSISNSYWDTDTSGTDQGSGDGNETGLTGLTTEQFQSGLPSGFDPAIWAEDSSINNGFPYLIANPPAK